MIIFKSKVVLASQKYLYRFKDPIEICRGDELEVECTFSTKGKDIDHYVHYGEGTKEEMCVGYVTYYPHMVGRLFEYQKSKVPSVIFSDFKEFIDSQIAIVVTSFLFIIALRR